MTSCEQGDIARMRFVLADESGAKRRPAVEFSTAESQAGRREAIIAAIPGNVHPW